MLSGVRVCWAKAGGFHIIHNPVLKDGAIDAYVIAIGRVTQQPML
ncbi:MAG: hypothetical protein WDO19_32890 [Bacteroidota bacterium]